MVPQSCRAEWVILAFDDGGARDKRAILRHTCDRDWNQSARPSAGSKGSVQGEAGAASRWDIATLRLKLQRRTALNPPLARVDAIGSVSQGSLKAAETNIKVESRARVQDLATFSKTTKASSTELGVSDSQCFSHAAAKSTLTLPHASASGGPQGAPAAVGCSLRSEWDMSDISTEIYKYPGGVWASRSGPAPPSECLLKPPSPFLRS
jgi:hypothetical protein